MLIALSRIWFELMPHNGNYLCNVLWQQLWDYRPVGEYSSVHQVLLGLIKGVAGELGPCIYTVSQKTSPFLFFK